MINFTSNYKFDVTKDNYKKANKAIDKISRYEGDDVVIHESILEDKKDGIYSTVNISADDYYDKYIEGILKQKKINFNIASSSQFANKEGILERIKASEYDINAGKKLIKIKTKELDKLFEQNKRFYVGYGGKGGIPNRYENVSKFIRLGLDIEPSRVYLSEDSNGPAVSFEDGRHRYAYMRDIGMEAIPVLMDEESRKIAEKYGFVNN